MKSLLLRMVCAIGLVVGFFWLIGYMLPRDYSITSSNTINRPAEDIFPMINDLQNWPRWSPWGAQTDLDIQYTGQSAGVGSVQTWTDPRGDGKLWITESEANERVNYKMISGGFPEMDSLIELTPVDNATKVTWTSEGRLPSGAFYGYFAIFFAPGMQGEYDRALERLKTAVED